MNLDYNDREDECIKNILHRQDSDTSKYVSQKSSVWKESAKITELKKLPLNLDTGFLSAEKPWQPQWLVKLVQKLSTSTLTQEKLSI